MPRRTVSTSGSSGTSQPRRRGAGHGQRSRARRRGRSTTSSSTMPTRRAAPTSYAASRALARRRVVARMHLGERSPAPTASPRFAKQTTPTAWSIASVLRPAAGAELERRDADRERAERVPRCRRAARDRRARPAPAGARRARVAALGADPPLVGGERRAVGDRRLGAAPALGDVDPEIGSASSRAQASSTSSVKSGGPSPRTVSSASRISSALPTARPSGWSMSVSRQTTSLAGPSPELEHLLREHARVVERLHERAVADLDVEHDRVGAGGELLRHDRRRRSAARCRRSPVTSRSA